MFRLLGDSELGDILLVEHIDRLTRLNLDDWQRLRREIDSREALIVSLDLPTSWMMMTLKRDEIQWRIFKAINNTTFNTMAAFARKDYEDRRRQQRQRQGIESAKQAGVHRGPPADTKRNDAIMAMLRKGQTWESIRNATGCSSSQLAARQACEEGHLMPIRPQHRWLYLIDWQQLTGAVRFDRAKGRCEQFRRPHGKLVCHLGDGRW